MPILPGCCIAAKRKRLIEASLLFPDCNWRPVYFLFIGCNNRSTPSPSPDKDRDSPIPRVGVESSPKIGSEILDVSLFLEVWVTPRLRHSTGLASSFVIFFFSFYDIFLLFFLSRGVFVLVFIAFRGQRPLQGVRLF